MVVRQNIAMSEIIATCVMAGAAVLLTYALRKFSRREELRKQLNTCKLTVRATYEILRMKVQHKHTRCKSNYYWFHRSSFPRILRWIIDVVLGVNSTNSLVDNPTKPSECVRIDSAIMQTEVFNAEVGPFLSEKLVELDVSGARDRVMFTGSDIVSSKLMKFDEPCIIDVWYRGHSNPSKKIPAKDYFVRYDLGAGEVAQFPPYGVWERQQKGFGARKIKSAVVESCNNLDVTAQAQKCAGPRRNFYVDCDDQAVVKSFIGVDDVTIVTYTGSGKGCTKILLHPHKGGK